MYDPLLTAQDIRDVSHARSTQLKIGVFLCFLCFFFFFVFFFLCFFPTNTY